MEPEISGEYYQDEVCIVDFYNVDAIVAGKAKDPTSPTGERTIHLVLLKSGTRFELIDAVAYVKCCVAYAAWLGARTRARDESRATRTRAQRLN